MSEGFRLQGAPHKLGFLQGRLVTSIASPCCLPATQPNVSRRVTRQSEDTIGKLRNFLWLTAVQRLPPPATSSGKDVERVRITRVKSTPAFLIRSSELRVDLQIRAE